MNKTQITKLYHDLQGIIENLNATYGFEWLWLLLGAIALIFFLLREKPVTNLVNWAIRLLSTGLKKTAGWLWRKIKKVKLTQLSPKLKKIEQKLDNLAASPFGRYDRPHYLILANGCDVNAIMSAANDHDADSLFLENSQATDKNHHHWYVFNKGCIFDFPDPVSVSSQLISLRPERPVDGIILCLSADFLLSKDPSEVQKLADKTYKQLWALQARLKFILPIYLIIADCEKIDGFEEYWQSLEINQLDKQMLGWSNPHDKVQPFQSSWIHQAFTSIGQRLRDILLTSVSPTKTCANAEQVLFPSRLEALQMPLKGFCETLFSDSSFHSCFMFRGFYFTGLVNQAPQQSANPNASDQRPWFVRDLFYKRIF